MCGIAGIVSLSGETSPESRHRVETMCKTLRHRGPDDEAYFSNGPVSLGMTRLAILDLRKNLYPITNEKGTIYLFYNGEIYNHHELTEQLSELGHRFTSKTDAEVVVHAYEEWGTECFRIFNGMWAFAMYDKESTKLFVARDHFGIKPLYFFKNNEVFSFSSEIRALLSSGFFKAEPNNRAVYTYLTEGRDDFTDQTFFQGVRRLPPGSYVTLLKGQLAFAKYWQMPQISRALSSKQFAEVATQARDLFVDSVRRRLVSDVPVGSCLSGGLDSSSIVCVISRLRDFDRKSVGKRLQAFFASYPDDPIDETKFARAAALGSGSLMHTVFPTSTDFWKELPELISTQEEPFESTRIYAQWKVMQLARKEGVTVLLDGQGADELFAGYDEYVAIYILTLIKRHRIFLALKETLSSIDVLMKFLPLLLKRRQSRKRILGCLKGEFLVQFAYDPDSNRFRFLTDLSKFLWNDIVRYNLPSLLRYEDKSSMHFSIETRLPFLDPGLAEYAASIPLTCKIRNGWTKAVLREALGSVLPPEIKLRRDKVAFGTPEYRWLFRELSSEIQTFFSSDLRSECFVKRDAILKLLRSATEGEVSRWEMRFLWRCLNLELWMRQFIEHQTCDGGQLLNFHP